MEQDKTSLSAQTTPSTVVHKKCPMHEIRRTALTGRPAFRMNIWTWPRPFFKLIISLNYNKMMISKTCQVSSSIRWIPIMSLTVAEFAMKVTISKEIVANGVLRWEEQNYVTRVCSGAVGNHVSLNWWLQWRIPAHNNHGSRDGGFLRWCTCYQHIHRPISYHLILSLRA
jgi:hypothetical protein